MTAAIFVLKIVGNKSIESEQTIKILIKKLTGHSNVIVRL